MAEALRLVPLPTLFARRRVDNWVRSWESEEPRARYPPLRTAMTFRRGALRILTMTLTLLSGKTESPEAGPVVSLALTLEPLDHHVNR